MQKWIYALAVSGKGFHEKGFFQSSNLIFSTMYQEKTFMRKAGH
jgi:hypothetical protein